MRNIAVSVRSNSKNSRTRYKVLTYWSHAKLKNQFLQHVGSKDQVAAKIDADTRTKLDEMNRALQTQKEQVIYEVLEFIYAIKPELHKNYKNAAK